MPNPQAVELVLTDEERAQLEAWARRRKSAQALAQRSRIVLAAAEGLANTEIARQLGIHRSVATRWRNRFAAHPLDGRRGWPQPDRRAPDLEGLRAPAASPGHVEALQGPAVHREGPRCCRALPQPARARGRALRGREIPDPGAGPHGADPADAPR